MASSRIIREGLIHSDKVSSLSWRAQALYTRLLLIADDYGLFDARPSILRTRLFPLNLDQITEQDIIHDLQECVNANLIQLYTHNNKPYLHIHNYQQRKQSKPKYPPPPKITETHSEPQEDTVNHREPPLKTNTNTNTNTNTEEECSTTVATQEDGLHPDVNFSPPLVFDRHEKVNPNRRDPTKRDAWLFVETLKIHPAWSKTLPTAAEQGYFNEMARACDTMTDRELVDNIELVTDYYKSSSDMDSKRIRYWRPDSRRKFWECFSDILAHAVRWGKETKWRSTHAKKKSPSKRQDEPKASLSEEEYNEAIAMVIGEQNNEKD